MAANHDKVLAVDSPFGLVRRAHPIKGWMAEYGVSNRSLAGHARVSEDWLSRVINGRARPSEQLVRTLAALLDRPAAELFRLADFEPRSAYPGNAALAERAAVR